MSDGRGKLKVFLGYAAGVGKTYQMLEEARLLKLQSADVVIGYFEPHARRDTIALTEGIEIVPRARIEYRGTVFEEMDTDALLARHPRVCIVDEFPHTNVPGCARTKRWEDVEALLELAALREMALRQTAHEVETRQAESPAADAASDAHSVHDAAMPAGQSRERILIHITTDPNTVILVRRGKRVADYLHTECFAVAVHVGASANDVNLRDRDAIEKHLNFARNLHIETRLLQGVDVAETLVEFARLNGITQIFIARPKKNAWFRPSAWALVEDIVHLAHDMRVTIVAQRLRN